MALSSRHLSVSGGSTSVFIGYAVGLGSIIAAISVGSDAAHFIDVGGLALVLGGTVGAVLVHFSLEDINDAYRSLAEACRGERGLAFVRLHRLSELARVARADGVLALERAVQTEPDPFFRMALQCAADGTPDDECRRIMSIESYLLDEKDRRGSEVLQVMGNVAPAMGLIGTVVGLVQMLGDLHDPSALETGMGTALLATLYGAILSYLIFLPLAGKIKRWAGERARIREMTVEGVSALIQQRHPAQIETQLQGFVSQ